MMGVAARGRPRYPPKELPLPPCHSASSAKRAASAGSAVWWPSDSAIATSLRGPRAVHQPRSLHHGLRAGAKASTDITYWPALRRGGVGPAAACARSRSVSAAWRTGDLLRRERKTRQRAEVVVLNNGIGTPRLLLTRARSSSRRARNQGPVTGIDVPSYAMVLGTFDEQLEGWKGPTGCASGHEFYETDRSRGFVRGYCRGRCGLGPASTTPPAASGRFRGSRHHRAYAESTIAPPDCSRCETPDSHNRVTLGRSWTETRSRLEDPLSAEREQREDARARSRARTRRRGRGREAGLSASWLASHGDRAVAGPAKSVVSE
jgi:hypothetical protein